MRFAALAFVLVPSLAVADDIDVKVDVDVKVRTPDPVIVVDSGGPPVVVVQAPPGPILRGSRWELGAFVEGGRFSANGFAGGQFGVRGEIARQLGSLRVAVEGSMAKFTADRDVYDAMGWWDGWEDAGGEISRVGITARLRTGMITEPTPLAPYRADLVFYIEGGAGQQYIAWNTGGSDERRDFMLGLGFEIAGGRDRMGGFDLNVRAVVAPSLDASVETHDVSVLVGLGGRFGT
jgi:hypothetical protein